MNNFKPIIPAELIRLGEAREGKGNWRLWGPYLAERQWGTVREDYSPTGDSWNYFTHDQARSRVYRWGEDGLLGLADSECRLCFGLALWNGNDPILKERLFGLTNSEGNHGEDVKECYYYLDSTPTHSYMKALYKYPHAAFPYDRLVEENRQRSRLESEFELEDTRIFDDGRYFDVFIEYAKASSEDILIQITAINRGKEAALLDLLPTLWFRNTWSWGRDTEYGSTRPRMMLEGDAVVATHETLGRYRFAAGPGVHWLFTENETNNERIFQCPNTSVFLKDGFHEYLIHGQHEAINPRWHGTKAAAYYCEQIPAGGELVVQLRLTAERQAISRAFGKNFDQILQQRRTEADEFYSQRIPRQLSTDENQVSRQAYAGLLWSKQFYEYDVRNWLEGDPTQPPPAESRAQGRNWIWKHLNASDVISMPDKWEYPWFAAWDLAFQSVSFAHIDPDFAKSQLQLLFRERYMHPSGQLPAYEFNFSDTNPPVHAWACWHLYKSGADPDLTFLAHMFPKLLINFTWWINRKDVAGHNLFSGGFLGLDNISVWDRSKPLPPGVLYAQADGTAWMAFYCLTMLKIALELSRAYPWYEDIVAKFFVQFISIADSMNSLGGTGLWHEEDGFYYDFAKVHDTAIPCRIRSLVGLIPVLAAVDVHPEMTERLPHFREKVDWFLRHRKEMIDRLASFESRIIDGHRVRLLSLPSRERLERILKYVFDENEFLSPYGIRGISNYHREHPCVVSTQFGELRADYEPGESTSGLFGGNSNWRGPIWFPLNYLIVESLERYHDFYGDDFQIECPTGSGRMMNLGEAAMEITSRLTRTFLTDADGYRPSQVSDRRYHEDPNWRDLILFYEYFHGDTGRGCGASHQTGWTALVARLMERVAAHRGRSGEGIRSQFVTAGSTGKQ